MRGAQGRKGVHFFRISKILYDGGKVKLMGVTRDDQKMILTKENYSPGGSLFKIL